MSPLFVTSRNHAGPRCRFLKLSITVRFLSPKWQNERAPFGPLGRGCDSMSLKLRRPGFLHLCVTRGSFSCEWESRPAVHSCGRSRDSLRRASSPPRTRTPAILQTRIKSRYNSTSDTQMSRLLSSFGFVAALNV